MALVEGKDTWLYGTTSIGGSNKAGTVFKLNKDGSGYSVLHHFGSSVGDGLNPQAGLVQASDGVLYGTTFFGGTNDMGTVFKLNTNGSGYGILHHFSMSSGDGQNPDTGLVEGTDKALYGTTFFGSGAGTVFKLNKDGSGFRILRDFTGTAGDGGSPDAALMQGSEGALYGTTYSGGSNNLGTVFTVNTNGTNYAVLHRFSSAGGDGQNPRAGLVSGSDGAFHGTTWSGGELGFGTVFRLLPPQTPEMLGVAILGSTVQVRLAGMSGYHYQVLRSTNLLQWVLLGTLTMPATGTGTNVDSAPPSGAAQYRAAWVP